MPPPQNTTVYTPIYLCSTQVSLAVRGGYVPISSDTSFIRYEIFYTQIILVIMVFRDRNSNIFNGFKRFFESKTWNCVL